MFTIMSGRESPQQEMALSTSSSEERELEATLVPPPIEVEGPKSDDDDNFLIRFPWKRDSMGRDQGGANVNAKPGEYVLQTLFLQFCAHAEKKIEQVLAEPLERPLAKSLQRGEDVQFDQLLSALGNVSEQSLPSLLRTLFKWYERQNILDDSLVVEPRSRHKSKGEKDFLCERRDLAVEFVYCLVLIEVLSKLSFHPAGHDDLVGYIITQAFRHFKYRDGLHASPNAGNIAIIADLYAEVMGTVAQARFQAVRKTFLSELRELKLRDQTPYTAQSIISLLMGLKFFRVKMHPIEDLESSCSFLHDLGKYFLEVKDKDIKHALAGLFVEILLPVAASAKNEVNVPVLKTFVDMLYSTTIDMATKKKHTLALFPLVTCLLCVSHKQFFLNNWPYFLTMCLSQLKNRDNKMSRVALESLYRLLWVYMVRIKCESNTATQSRLQSIVNSLFPKGSKIITPRDTPLNIFVKIIQFIAKERLDFAMREIIFDLLCVGRQIKFLTPERMSIGLRAFLVIADSLQQKDGDPPMPQTMATLPSGNTVRHKKTFLNKFLTDSTAKLIGIALYYPHVLKTLDSIFRALDLQVGRPLLLTKPENVSKDPDEMLTTDRKPKIDLFRTCVASIPRLIPDGMTPHELVELLTRLTVHVDEELKGLAFQALQNLMHESFEWREQVVRGFVQFIQKEIGDTNTQLLDGTLRMLIQLLVNWKSGSHGVQTGHSFREKFGDTRIERPNNSPSNRSAANLVVLHEVEGLALVMLCNTRLVTRKLALHLLKEIRTIVSTTGSSLVCEPCLIDVMDKACPLVLEKLLALLPHNEKAVVLMSPNIDLTWVIDRSSSVWPNNHSDATSDPARAGTASSQSSFSKLEIWMCVLAELVTNEFARGSCPHAVSHAWPIVFARLSALFQHVDPSLLTNETRASSILRSGSKKVTTERDLHMNLWRNYVVMACCIAQKTSMVPHRCASPELSSSPESNSSDKSEGRQTTSSSTATSLFHMLVPLMKCDCADMRDSIVNGLGHTNSDVFRELVEELLPFLKEAIDKKQDNIKRRRKRDLLRVQLARIFELMAENRTFAQTNSGVIDKEKHCLIGTFVDYIDGARQYLEGESDRDLPILQEIRLHFSGFVHYLIRNTPPELRETLLTRELRYSLFHLFASWSGRFCPTFGSIDRRLVKEESCSDLELSAVRAMSSVLCCGPVFDPSGLNDDGYVYQWLDNLLKSHDEKIYKLAKETVVLLLDFNSEVQVLLEWVIDRCYTGSNEVADGCFGALAAVFQTREYPCDDVAMLNLAVLNIGSPRVQVHEIAIQLIHLLDKRFFQQEPVFSVSLEDNCSQVQSLNDVYLAVAYSRSQMFVSEQLARLHPELTMPMFSEITHRFQTAKPSIQGTLLHYLLPWLHNMELVDPTLPPSNPLSNFLTRLADNQGEVFRAPLKGEGWGSPQATEMVLNNLFYITVKYGDNHPREIGTLWAALVMCWPTNLKVVLRYLLILTSMAAELLPYAKRVVSYLGRAKPEKLVDELMNELQTVETLNMNIERTQTPPFYRLSSVRKVVNSNNTTDDEKLVGHGAEAPLEKGMLHTKRHSTLTDEVPSDSTPRTNSTTSLRSISSTSSGATDHINLSLEEEGCPTPTKAPEPKCSDTPQPYPLPMPAYGGYFAPLSEYLPEAFVPTPGYHRSNIAVMLLSELVVDGLEIDWSAHIPLMLHIIFLGLDHSKVLVYEHCKKLLQNLLLLLAAHEHPHIARNLCANKTNLGDNLALIAEEKLYSVIGTTASDGLGGQVSHDSITKFSIGQSTLSVDSSATVTPENSDTQLPDLEAITNVDEVMQIIVSLIKKRLGRPLWSYEDITSKSLTIHSATQLEYLLKCVVQVCKELAPLSGVEQRWAQIALQLALSCSSRHYAGRSFQIVRALRVRPSTQMLTDILSRLVETVAEQGDDMQGYVTEIMLTLEAAVDYLEMEVRPTDFMRELFMSTPNLAKETWAENRKSAPIPPSGLIGREPPPHHNRTTSYSVSVATGRMAVTPGGGDARHRSSTEMTAKKTTNLARSRSAQSLKNLDQNSTEDKLTILTQMFWIAVSMLESDYEYEFQLATRLLEQILKHLQPGRPDCREKLDKILQQIKWPNFPGVQSLLLKGCTSQGTAEMTWSLLSHLTLCINAPVIDPTGALGFPMNVIALLPYLVQNYESPGQVCRDAADRISQTCSQQSEHLGNLATVMSLYSHGTFGKDSFQWTKCVVKYLHDVYSCASLSMITFLVEVLERGPVSCQPAVLQILYCLVHYVDISKPPTHIINIELFKNVAKHVEGSHSRDALKILKLAVTRSSTLTAAPPSMSASISSELSPLMMAHTSFAEAEVYFKKELPGRTLDFTVNLTETPYIGRKYIHADSRSSDADGSAGNPALALARKPSANMSDTDSGWRRPSASQARTRDRLVNLLTCYGPRVGLPKSPSDTAINKVIFSQSSDTLDHQQSVASGSSEEASITDAISSDALLNETGGNELLVFKRFDFLNELEENEDDNYNYSSLSNRHQSLSQLDRPETPTRTHFSSVPDLAALTSSAEAKQATKSDSVSLREEDAGMTSEDEESHSESPADDGMPQDLPAPGSIIMENPVLLSSPLTTSTHSLHSSYSDGDIVELSSSTASPNFSHLSAAFLNVQSDEVEDLWRSHVSKVMADSTAVNVISTCQIFPRLYKELRRRMANVTKEACYYVSKTESLKSLAWQILQILNILIDRMECPHVFTEPETIMGTRVVEKHRFCVLEIQECYETYSMRKDQVEQCLDDIKASIKQQSLGECGAICGEEQKMELCRRLYKLHFQLVLLFENYMKLLEVFHTVANSPQVVDFSIPVTVVRSELTQAAREMEHGQVSPLQVDSKVVSRQEALTSLAEYLNGERYLKAIQLLRAYRASCPLDLFGQGCEDDIVALLNIYCRGLADKRSGVFVMTKVDLDLGELHSQLMDLHVQLELVWSQISSTSQTMQEREEPECSVIILGESEML